MGGFFVPRCASKGIPELATDPRFGENWALSYRVLGEARIMESLRIEPGIVHQKNGGNGTGRMSDPRPRG